MNGAGPVAAGIQTFGQLWAAKGAIERGRFNQAVAERNAQTVENDGAAEALALGRDVRRTIGAQLAAQGGSGFQMGTGSFADAIAESQVEGMLDVLNMRRKTATEAQALRLQGDLARKDARASAAAHYFGAAATAAGAGAKYGAR